MRAKDQNGKKFRPEHDGSGDQMHPDDRRNLVIFLIISLAMYFAFDHFVMKPKVEAMRAQQGNRPRRRR